MDIAITNFARKMDGFYVINTVAVLFEFSLPPYCVSLEEAK